MQTPGPGLVQGPYTPNDAPKSKAPLGHRVDIETAASMVPPLVLLSSPFINRVGITCGRPSLGIPKV